MRWRWTISRTLWLKLICTSNLEMAREMIRLKFNVNIFMCWNLWRYRAQLVLRIWDWYEKLFWNYSKKINSIVLDSMGLKCFELFQFMENSVWISLICFIICCSLFCFTFPQMEKFCILLVECCDYIQGKVMNPHLPFF